MPDKKTGELRGNRNLKRLEKISQTRQQQEIERGLEFGLEAAGSINDRTISLFSRGHQPAFAGINTFMKAPYCEDMRNIGQYEAAFVGIPFDTGTTYRPGARFGPQAVRQISALYDGFSVDGAVDMQEMDMDERMHTTPWFWTTNGHNHENSDVSTSHHSHSHMHDVGLSNCPPKNLVQMGIGGWYGSRPGSQVARERGSSVMTMTDIEESGVKKAAEMALDLAWKDAKAVYLSFDIDSIDPGFAPGTGSPEPGGLLPREALQLVRLIAREGLCGMEVVEVAPPYDVNQNTSQLACRIVLDVLGTLTTEGKLGHRSKVKS